MRLPHNANAPAQSCSSGEGTDNHLRAGVSEQVTPETPMRQCCIAWYGWGLVHGIERGREQADAQAATRHHRAYEVVQQMAKLPTHDELTRRRTTYTPWSGAA